MDFGRSIGWALRMGLVLRMGFVRSEDFVVRMGLVLGVALALGLSSSGSVQAQVAKPALTVTLASVRQETLPLQLAANGSLAAWQESVIGAQVNGLRLTEVRVDVGDRVRKGERLALLQSDTVRAELAQAEGALGEARANLEEAQAQANRARSLQAQGFFSSAQLTQSLAAEAAARARLQSAQAALTLQTVRLAQTEILAPDAGVISARSASLGSVVNAGSELFRLIRQGRLEWRAEVTASEIERIAIGAKVRVTAASGAQLTGRVRMIAPALDPQTRNALVYVDLEAPLGSARAGMFARGEIFLGNNQAWTIPQTAVAVRDGFSYVYCLGPEQRVVQTKIQTGRRIGDRIEVTAGLDETARVVSSGAAFLNHGDLVRVVPASVGENPPAVAR